MPQRYPEPRVFTPLEFYSHVRLAFRSFPRMLRSRRRGIINKPFTERIMLAVTEVNGCKYCSYYHTRLAMQEGISKADIRALRRGEVEDIPEDEILALNFAQHYADTGGKPDPGTRNKLIDTYGPEKAMGIEANIKAIMVGNIYGIAFDGLARRIKGKKMKDSKLVNELGIAFGSLLMFPAAIVHNLIRPLK